MTEVSVVIPTKNEEESIGICIEKIQKVFSELQLDGEIIVADNSTDSTPEIARKLGVKVIVPDRPGYGYAYRFGFEHASGDYIIMGDGDNTYDFDDIPRLLEPLKSGEADLVMGSRFKGEIKRGAMPWLHHYIGNHLLTWCVNKTNGAAISDCHSGFRAFTRSAYERMALKTDGMEFASEMVMRALLAGLRVTEIPITYYPRAKGAEPNLKSFSDGWRHLKFILLNAPDVLFLWPGSVLFALGLLLVILIWAPFNLWEIPLGFHAMIAACLFALVGYQILFLGLFAKIYTIKQGLRNPDRTSNVIAQYLSLERGVLAGLVIFLVGFVVTLYLLWNWVESGYSALPLVDQAIAAFTLLVVGIQTIFSSLFLSIIAGGEGI